MMSEQIQDSVEREILVEAPIGDVFEGLTDPSRFPSWGPISMDRALAADSVVTLDFGPSGGGKVAVYVEALDVPTTFAFRWAQGESDPIILLEDPRTRPNTLVTFSLRETEDGTLVQVLESGFLALAEQAVAKGLTLGHVGTDMAGAGWTLMLSGLARSFGAAETPIADYLEAEITVPVGPDVVFQLLVNPDKWWAASVEGTVAKGETPILDFGPFGRWMIYVEDALPNEYVAFRRVQGTDEPDLLVSDPRTTTNSLVEFLLESSAGETRVRLRECGYDALPPESREMYFRRWEQAWGMVLGLLQMHTGPK